MRHNIIISLYPCIYIPPSYSMSCLLPQPYSRGNNRRRLRRNRSSRKRVPLLHRRFQRGYPPPHQLVLAPSLSPLPLALLLFPSSRVLFLVQKSRYSPASFSSTTEVRGRVHVQMPLEAIFQFSYHSLCLVCMALSEMSVVEITFLPS